VGATVVTMGLLSLPTMLRRGYDQKLACGAICASGTLGQIIPPSIVLVLLADIIQGAYADAQRRIGNWAPEPVSVIDLFAGAFIPGMALVAMYMLWVLIVSVVRPQATPPVAVPPEETRSLFQRVLVSLVPPAALIVAVLGSILAGIATPTESAAVGAVGATLLAAMRRQLTGEVLRTVMRSTMMISSMVFVILLGASMFSLTFRDLGGDVLVHDLLTDMPGGMWGAIFVVMALMFVMGFFLDFIEIIFVVVPIVGPVLLMMDMSPVWLGVMIAVNLQTSFLTPPFGFALFYLRGVAPPEVRTIDIYKGIIPFVIIQLVMLLILAMFPQLATWLPDVLV
jgi:tripartite ATP-independent transporter DctM subunit